MGDVVMRKILIVDDEPLAVQAVRLVLAKGHRISVVGDARSAAEGLRLFTERHPDIVIADIRLPGESGLDMIGKMRAIEPSTRAIILTAYPEFAYAQRAVSLGVSEYLLKPITPTALTQALDRVIGESSLIWEYVEKTLGSRLRDISNPYLSEALQLMASDLRGVQTKKLAQALYVSESHLCRLFREETGKTLGEFTKEVRILVAEDMLTGLSESIRSVSSSLGFNDPGYFSRVFRKSRGMSPSEFRRSRKHRSRCRFPEEIGAPQPNTARKEGSHANSVCRHQRGQDSGPEEGPSHGAD
jgi:two-component system response regulator YesN